MLELLQRFVGTDWWGDDYTYEDTTCPKAEHPDPSGNPYYDPEKIKDDDSVVPSNGNTDKLAILPDSGSGNYIKTPSPPAIDPSASETNLNTFGLTGSGDCIGDSCSGMPSTPLYIPGMGKRSKAVEFRA